MTKLISTNDSFHRALCFNYFTFRGYVFTAPNKFLAGETERGCLSLHNLQPPALVLLELLPPTSAKNEQPLASTNVVMDTGKRFLKHAFPKRLFTRRGCRWGGHQKRIAKLSYYLVSLSIARRKVVYCELHFKDFESMKKYYRHIWHTGKYTSLDVYTL